MPLLMLACTPRPTPGPAPEATRGGEAASSGRDAGSWAQAPAPMAVRDAAPAPSASALDGAVPRPLPDAGTRGTVACGNARCFAQREACVEEETGPRCVSDAAVTGSSEPPRKWCDDDSDCESGTSCCVAPDVVTGTTGCMPPDTVDLEPCTMQACVVGDGAPCPAGQACEAGYCRRSPRERATCSGGARCPAASPVCHWDKGKGTCGIVGTPGLQCTKKSDCGKEMSCCIVKDMGATSDRVTQTECRRACGTLLLEDVCENSADCPVFLVTGAHGGLRKQTCVPRPASQGVPPWMRQCAVP